MIQFQVAQRHGRHPIGEIRLETACRDILADHDLRTGELSLAIVDDDEMQVLNRTFLNHDYPTDVLSFVLERAGTHLDGELIVSIQTAERESREIGWPVEDELLLYVIHGTLHLVGYDDATDTQRKQMRELERRYLQRLGVSTDALAESW